eukprot:TRINITY_DN200_c0_g2_i2.p1 TRINITY_DN200_c0_g2~~TRINITY_DN200_c0_g2_i2.p1  ORF type:complete len:424 (-),score=53.13 TRINITY_DN200_c0_g2_i2:104-1375(-)
MLFWRNEKFFNQGQIFGTKSEFELFRTNYPGIKMRWDDSSDDPAHCHHEKSWLFDCGEPTEVVITGGITITGALNAPGHSDPGNQRHDVDVEVKGPAGSDHHHHFCQRWNHANLREQHQGSFPDLVVSNDLPYPNKLAPTESNEDSDACAVQVLRTMRPKFTMDSTPAPLAPSFDLSQGEESIYEAYKMAINNAKRWIYIENQHICDEEMMSLLARALERGVKVVFVAPSWKGIYFLIHFARNRTQSWVDGGRKGPKPRYSDVFLENLVELSKFKNFTLCSLASYRGNSTYSHIYVHSKLMIVDESFMMVGSANFVDISWRKDHTEVDYAIWGRSASRRMARELWKEHTLLDIENLDKGIEDIAKIASENEVRFFKGEPLVGILFRMPADAYGSSAAYLTVAQKASLYASYLGIKAHQWWSGK